MYVLLAVVHIDLVSNYICGLIFEIIGFLLLLAVLLSCLFGNSIKTGYLVPIVIYTAAYTVFLDLLNIVGITIVPPVFFVLLHLVLLFLYLMVVMPMLVMGKR